MIYNENCEHCRQKLHRGMRASYSPALERRNHRRHSYGGTFMNMPRPRQSSMPNRLGMPGHSSLPTFEPQRHSVGPVALTFPVNDYSDKPHAYSPTGFDQLWDSLGFDAELNSLNTAQISTPMANTPNQAFTGNIQTYGMDEWSLGTNQSPFPMANQDWPFAPPSSPDILLPSLSMSPGIPVPPAPLALETSLVSPEEDFFGTLNFSPESLLPGSMTSSFQGDQDVYRDAVLPANLPGVPEKQADEIPDFALEGIRNGTIFIQ